MSNGTLKIGPRTMEVNSIEHASSVYATLRDREEKAGRGGSQFPSGKLEINGTKYRVSYNAKVWADKEWQSGDVPVFNPYASAVQP